MRLVTDWSSFSEYKCHPRQYLPLLKANYARGAEINAIFQNNTGFDAAAFSASSRTHA